MGEWNESKLGKFNRFLDEFSIVDYVCCGAEKLPENGELQLHLEKNDKKVYVYVNDLVYGSLKLNEMEQRYIFAILSAGENIIECKRIPTDDNSPIEQKFKVGLWMKKCKPEDDCNVPDNNNK